MINWRNKTDLINWLQDHAPTPSTKRALQTGQSVTLLGGFKPLPNSNSPGFIVRFESLAGRLYHVAIAVDNFRSLRTFLIDYIDWGHYVGTDSNHELYRGDVPTFAFHQKTCNVFERLKNDNR